MTFLALADMSAKNFFVLYGAPLIVDIPFVFDLTGNLVWGLLTESKDGLMDWFIKSLGQTQNLGDFFVDRSLQPGQLYSAYTLKKDLPFAFYQLTRPSKAGKESFLGKILLSD